MGRKIFRLLSLIIVVFFTTGILLSTILRNPFVQTYLVRVVSIHLSEYLNTNVKIEKLNVSAFLNVRVENIEINDLQNKPLIHFKKLYASSDLFNLYNGKIDLNKVEIDSASIFIRKYKGEENFNYINLLNRFIRSDNGDDTDSIYLPHKALALNIKQVDVKNSRFVYQLEDEITFPEYGIDYHDIDIQDIDFSLKNVSILKDSVRLILKHISLDEKSGFKLSHLEGDYVIYSKGMQFKNALLETGNSNMEFNLNFAYRDWQSLAQFVDDINLNVEILSGQLNTVDIAFFAPDLKEMNNPFQLSGIFSGPIRNLRARNIILAFGDETEFDGNIQMTGLPKILETFISLKVQNFSTSVSDIKHLQFPGAFTLNQFPDILNILGAIKIKGNFTGFYNDFVSNAKFTTNIGQLTTDIQFSNNPNRNIIEYQGDFQARKFDLGQLLESEDSFGKLDFDLKVKGEGLDMASLYANVDGEINNFQFKNKQLADIAINGLFQERQFTGDISIVDKLINADFQGHINFDSLVPIFNFDLKLVDTYLGLLGLFPVDSSAVLSSNIKLNFIGNTLDNIRGEINLDSTSLEYEQRNYFMKSFQIKTSSGWSANRLISLHSDFIDGQVEGNFQISELKNTGQLFLHNYLPNLVSTANLNFVSYTKNMNWNIQFKDLSDIMPLLYEPLQISKNSSWTGSFNAESNTIESQITLQNADYKGIKFNNLQLNIDNKQDALNADLTVETLVFKEPAENDTLQLGIDNLRFSSKANNDSIQFSINWKNKLNAIKNIADIAGGINLSKDSVIDLKFLKADLVINDSSWVINPLNRFIIRKDKLDFEKVGFYSGSQRIELTGTLGQQNNQAFKVNFNNFNISNFDILFNYKGIDFDGKIDGEIQLRKLMDSYDFMADLRINKFFINKELLGDLQIKSKRNLDRSVFLNAEILKTIANNQIEKPLVFEGTYFPVKKDNSLDFSLFLNHLPTQVLSPLLFQWVDDLNGTMTGNATLKGNLEMPDLKGNIKLESVGLKIKYLNTRYTLNANAFIDNYFIDFRDADMRDEMNNSSTLYGGIFHDHLKNFGVDVSLGPQNFMGLNTRKGMNSIYYGKAFVTGSVDIKGQFGDAIDMNMNLQAGRGSEMIIPISLTADVSGNEFITFVNYQDTLQKKNERKQIQELSNFSLNMDLSLNSDAKVEIILPEDLGNIQSVGYGDLNLNMNRAGNFTMAGDYIVNKGTFLFTIKNIYKKSFDLVDGGTISWTGDPYAGELNMKAVYHVKTSLNTLGATQDTTFRSRVPVDCVIGLSDKILNPTVKFGFEFPNSPEEVRQLVFSQIDTTNEAEMSQQMLSLLVLNSFSFSSAALNENFATNVGGSSLQLVANQLGNWLSQINNNLDVGINYRPGGAITNEEVEVALSTQLFNERVTVDGNFGYQNLNNLPNSNTSNIVGDINVEVKITKDGRFRLKAFNRTNTIDLYDNIAPYTQGVGIFYRKEFNFFKDLFKRKKEEKPEDATNSADSADANSGSKTENNSSEKRPLTQKSIRFI